MCVLYSQNVISCLLLNTHQNRGPQLPDTNMVLSTILLSRVLKDTEHCCSKHTVVRPLSIVYTSQRPVGQSWSNYVTSTKVGEDICFLCGSRRPRRQQTPYASSLLRMNVFHHNEVPYYFVPPSNRLHMNLA